MLLFDDLEKAIVNIRINSMHTHTQIDIIHKKLYFIVRYVSLYLLYLIIINKTFHLRIHIQFEFHVYLNHNINTRIVLSFHFINYYSVYLSNIYIYVCNTYM
jgi:hypothetical protein